MLIIYILSLIPILIWAFMEPLSFRFSDLNTITTSIGQILGLLGMVLFSINLILAGKFKFIDKHFKGLDKVYKNHHKIGAIAFSIMLFHPIFLVIKFITISIKDAGLFFIPFVNMPITWGIISLIILILLICLTFYVKLKYKNWKISHKFMTLAFFFAVLHTFFISSDVSRNNLLRYYILILSLIALFSIFRKVFFEKLPINKYIVKNVNNIAKDTLEIEMEPLKKKINFNEGQFAFFSFISKEIDNEYHPFSFSSSSKENNIKIIVKNFGDYTNELKKLKINDIAYIDGPYGGFSYKNANNKNQIWIAGGIGITPFLSMSKELENDYKINLFYSVKEDTEAIKIDELELIKKNNQNFNYNLWITKDKGFITSEIILKLNNDDIKDKDIFLCGPPVFMESLKNQFLSIGVDIKNIHYENFSF